MNALKWVAAFALLCVFLQSPGRSRADWVSQGYWVSYVASRYTDDLGTAAVWGASSSGASIGATAEAGRRCGADVVFATSWYWDYVGQWYSLYVYVIADTLDGAAGAGSVAKAGYSEGADFSIERRTDVTGNPFSRQEVQGPWYAFNQGSSMAFHAWVWCEGREGGATEASGHVFTDENAP